MTTDRKTKKIISTAVKAVLVVIVCVFGLFLSDKRIPDSKPEGALRVMFFDVGEADCSLAYGDGISILTDAPKDKTRQAAGVMRRAGIKRLDLLVITHYDYDHCGDAVRILEEFGADTVLLPEPGEENERRLCAAIKEKSDGGFIFAKTGQSYDINGARAEILAPNGAPDKNNALCIVYKLSYNGKSVLMCADAEVKEEKVILSKYKNELRSDIIKVAHHGSKYSSSSDFIKAVNAKYAVISCGANGYGHPDLGKIDAFEQSGAEVFITQRDGVVIFDLLPDGVEKVK